MDPKSVLLGLREKSVGLSKAQTRVPWREIIKGVAMGSRLNMAKIQKRIVRIVSMEEALEDVIPI